MIYLLRRLSDYFASYKNMLLMGMLFVGLSSFLKSLQGKYIRILTDAITGIPNYPPGFSFIIFNIGWMLLLSVLSGFFMFLMRQQIIVMSRHIEYDQKNDIFLKFLHLPHRFFISGRVGDLMNRIGEDVGKVRMFTGPAIMYLTHSLVSVVTVVVFMFSTSMELALYVLFPLPFLSLFIYVITSKIHQNALKSQEALSDITSLVQESMHGIRIIRSASRQEIFEDRMKHLGIKYKDRNIRLIRADALFGPVVTFLISLTILITVWKGVLLMKEGKIGSGNITEFIFYLYQLTWPITSVGWVLSLIQRAKASQERMDVILKEPSVVPEGSMVPASSEIVLKDIHFSYGFKKVLQGMDLHIEQNTITGLTGRTGCGKTTLVYVLSGMMEPDRGEYFIGGVQRRNVKEDWWNEKVSFLFQEPLLFSDTIKNNILFGVHRQVGMEEIEFVCRTCCIYEDILQMPSRFDSLVGERGINLSGGQKQRIALARALIRRPEILVMDDCLSALDSITAKKILWGMKEHFKDLTLLIISSRLSDMLYCNRIHFMENGKISCSGQHEELLLEHKEYRNLWELQEGGFSY